MRTRAVYFLKEAFLNARERRSVPMQRGQKLFRLPVKIDDNAIACIANAAADL